MQIQVVGLDIAKQIFKSRQPTRRAARSRRLRRGQVLDYFRELPSSLIGREACATAHRGAATA
jgi:transposase